MSFGYSRWYYQSSEPDGTSFVVGRSFQLQYVTTGGTITWTAPTSCTLGSTSSASTTATCSAPGVYAFTVTSTTPAAADTFYVTVIAATGCYQWYFTTGTQNVVSVGSSLTGYIWIVDPAYLVANAGSAEALGTATSPSTNSKAITTGYANIGESPVVSFAGSTAGSLTSVVYNSAQGYWKVTFAATSPQSIPVSITGHQISIMDCVIEPKMVMIYIQPNYVTTWFVTASSASTGSTAFNIFPNACTPNLMLATSSNYGVANVAVSKSYFLASNEPILTGAYNLDSSGVKAIAATSLGVTVLTTNSAVYFVNFASMSPIQATGLGSGITNIRAANICSSQSKNLNTHVVAWMSISGVTAFYYSTDGGQTFFAVDLVSNLSVSGTAKIRDILVSQQQQSYIIMIRDGTNDKLFLYNTVLGTVTAGYSFGSSNSVIDSNAGASPFMTEGQGSLLFSGDSLFMSPDFGQTMFTVTLQSRDSARPATGLASSEWVKQTVIAPDGSAFAVLTSNNRLFYGQPGISTAIELTSGLLTTSLAQIGFDGLQRLIVYTPTSTANYVISRVIPVSNEILSPRAPTSANPTLICPYSSWSTSLSSVSTTVDIGETFTITATVKAANSVIKDVLITLSNYSILSLNSSSSIATSIDIYAPPTNLITQQTTFMIQPNSTYLSGTSQLGIRPKAANLACPSQFKTISCIVGCPSTRRIVLRTNSTAPTVGQTYPTSIDCTLAPTSVFLAAGTWISDWATFSRPNYDKYVSYNCGMYGLPVDAWYGTPFTPVFDVYDGNVFVKTVTANVGLWEMNGRPFGYNMTNAGAGCIGAAQTWTGLVQAAGGAGGNPLSAWGPNNYVSCFQSGSTLSNPNDAYTIFNQTNKLGIVWTGGTSGLYLFTAKVVDPTFSYCTLTATFAVNVYGAPVSAGIQAGVMIGLTLIFFAVLAASYFLYLRERRLEAKEKEQEEIDGEGEESKDDGADDGMLWKEKLE